MQKTATVLSIAALLVAIAALLRPETRSPAFAGTTGDSWKDERQYPPLIFTGRAWLDCSISSNAPGRQLLKTTSGQGFTFDAPMLPIKDGQVKLKGAGMMYKFNSFPSHVVAAHFTGLGDGAITAMKTEVEVDVKRFQQPGGPGTNIRFSAADLDPNSAYVEFTGVWVRDNDHKRFPFRVLFGSVPSGGGQVTPGSAGSTAPLVAKSVSLGTPQVGATVTTAMYEAEDDVASLH